MRACAHLDHLPLEQVPRVERQDLRGAARVSPPLRPMPSGCTTERERQCHAGRTARALGAPGPAGRCRPDAGCSRSPPPLPPVAPSLLATLSPSSPRHGALRSPTLSLRGRGAPCERALRARPRAHLEAGELEVRLEALRGQLHDEPPAATRRAGGEGGGRGNGGSATERRRGGWGEGEGSGVRLRLVGNRHRAQHACGAEAARLQDHTRLQRWIEMQNEQNARHRQRKINLSKKTITRTKD